ncbi:MAG: hypothetical protein COA86_17850 [Kangiella sp.]|nr:MAG: hypothetical protein COA86_17850 [Kangiella sp.]
MSTAAIQERDRITARVTKKVKQELEDAAALLGSTLNEFMVQSALERAHKILERDQIISLTAADSAVFFQALDNPSKPNDALKKAFAKYAG